MSPLLACTQLTQVYRVGDSEVIALQGLDLRVDEAEMLGVVGASGSGKSTLMQVLSGLLRPAGGKVLFDGMDLGTASRRELDEYRRSSVGFVRQDAADNLVPYLTALQNVAVQLELRGESKARARAHDALELVGLADRANNRPVELSGGEQQRAALAAALVHGPRLLLADEPTGALDTQSTEAMFELMRQVGRESNLTQIIVSHDTEIARHVDRVVALRDGRVGAEQRWLGDADSSKQIDEVLVIDTIGRLQLTDEQRAALGNVDRVYADIDGDAIAIRPADSGNDR